MRKSGTRHIASPKSAPTAETETRRLLDALAKAKAKKEREAAE